MGEIYSLHNQSLKFKKGFCTFNGNIYLSNRKIKENHKYYVYSKETNQPYLMLNKEKMKILSIEKESDFNIIFYVDSNSRLSFVKVKHHKALSNQELIDKIEKTPFYRMYTLCIFQFLFFIGVVRFRSYSFEEINLSFGYNKSINVKVNYLFPQKIRSFFSMKTNKLSLLIHLCWCRISFKKLIGKYQETSDINVPIFIKVKNSNFNYYYSLKKKNKDKYDKKHYLFNTRSVKIHNTMNELFVRKSITGQYVIVFTSLLKKRIKLVEIIAFLCSLFFMNKKKYNIYFEKFCEGASESGFELFKFAVKRDKDSIYILSNKNPFFKDIKRMYPNNVIAKNSFKAFFYVFLANSFISSDLVSHIQRRLYDNDVMIKKKILSNNKKIFLQHGVCLATNVFERGYYNTKVPIAPDYIIVNSKFEQSLFTTYSNYKKNQLILTGLPNLDIYSKSKNDKKNEITFFLTWRPWDLTNKIEEGSYLARYRQFINLVNSDEFYRGKKVNIILHPKSQNILREQFPDFYYRNCKYFYNGDIKDALIKTKVLISDYSSVTFFAFSGGSNIVFYWEDKERAEKEYGAPNILQKEIAFGDITYKFKDLQQLIEENYYKQQKPNYQTIFGKLVENQDGENTKNTFEYIESMLNYKNEMDTDYKAMREGITSSK